ncbi:N,N-dimethylformamidase beta subunit family domain-containing protein [Amycolatopsis taiwanensis]|nr:N,N-dimethylformamidase beta subunit family domain-containing protein [Amycolatopsis taiwanensis]
MKRRGAMLGLAVVLAVTAGWLSGPAAPPLAPATPVTPRAAAPAAGTPGWEITQAGPEHAIEGFADQVSVLPGDDVRLFVNTTATSYTVTAYRMGAYRDADAQRVWVSAPQPGHQQPPPTVQEPTNTVVAPWQPSLTVSTRDWRPGDYLFRLDGDNGAQQFVPLTVRTPSNAGKIIIINAVTTWQAYNRWGGYSLYTSPSGGKAQRARAVSFDRPYQAMDMQGSGDFLYFELPLVRFAENSGLSLGYATDVDLHADPHLADGAAAMVTLGHDEYWSAAMRRNATAARDRGVNLAFFGGNEVYRHIRFEPTPLGPDRLEVDYKSFAEDPYHITNPLEATPEWRSPPFPRPESVLVGGFYQCNPVHADFRVADDANWLLAGIVHNGQSLPGMVGNEYQSVDLSVPTPRPIEVLFHSPLTCQGRPDFADTTYYTVPSGAAVFAAGTQNWICALGPRCAADHDDSTTRAAISAITLRLLRAFAAGPTGRNHPAVDNLATLGVRGATPNPAPVVPPDNSSAP